MARVMSTPEERLHTTPTGGIPKWSCCQMALLVGGLDALRECDLVLASASARRKEILSILGVSFRAVAGQKEDEMPAAQKT